MDDGLFRLKFSMVRVNLEEAIQLSSLQNFGGSTQVPTFAWNNAQRGIWGLPIPVKDYDIYSVGLTKKTIKNKETEKNLFKLIYYRPVKVIRLISKNTVEEIILKRAEDKLKLTSTVIKEGEFSLGATKQSFFTDDKVKV